MTSTEGREGDKREELADRVDEALEAAWKGDFTTFDRLAQSDGDDEPTVGQLFGNVIGQPGKVPESPDS